VNIETEGDGGIAYLEEAASIVVTNSKFLNTTCTSLSGFVYRKVILIFISVFIQNYGAISQAMIVFLLLIIFFVINTNKKPFVSIALNDLETYSLASSMITIYCGIFYISD
jgi:hypothetical protein